MFFKYNTQLGPPYQVLVDTNFINFSIKNKVGGPAFLAFAAVALSAQCLAVAGACGPIQG